MASPLADPRHRFARPRRSTRRSRSSTCSTCSRTRRARACTSATRRATPRPTSSRATSACAASTCLHPMGWDAFGLPAEQHAIKTGTHPPSNTARQHRPPSGASSRRSASPTTGRARSTPPTRDYVRWTQWIFLQLFERGLAFQGEIPVNWCPALGTVLANEEVIDGERARRLPGRAPAAAPVAAAHHRLRRSPGDELEPLDWPETKRSSATGSAAAKAPRSISQVARRRSDTKIRVFTTRPDTLFGATYMVLAPEHPLVAIAQPMPPSSARIAEYIAAAARKSDLERTGRQGEDRRVHRRVTRSTR